MFSMKPLIFFSVCWGGGAQYCEMFCSQWCWMSARNIQSLTTVIACMMSWNYWPLQVWDVPSWSAWEMTIPHTSSCPLLWHPLPQGKPLFNTTTRSCASPGYSNMLMLSSYSRMTLFWSTSPNLQPKRVTLWERVSPSQWRTWMGTLVTLYATLFFLFGVQRGMWTHALFVLPFLYSQNCGH